MSMMTSAVFTRTLQDEPPLRAESYATEMAISLRNGEARDKTSRPHMGAGRGGGSER